MLQSRSKAHQREKLERVCRYVARGTITLERLSVDGDGLVVYELKHPFSDATTHVLFEPLDFIARLAASGSRARAPICCAIMACSHRMPNIATTLSQATRPQRRPAPTPMRPSPPPR